MQHVGLLAGGGKKGAMNGDRAAFGVIDLGEHGRMRGPGLRVLVRGIAQLGMVAEYRRDGVRGQNEPSLCQIGHRRITGEQRLRSPPDVLELGALALIRLGRCPEHAWGADTPTSTDTPFEATMPAEKDPLIEIDRETAITGFAPTGRTLGARHTDFAARIRWDCNAEGRKIIGSRVTHRATSSRPHIIS